MLIWFWAANAVLAALFAVVKLFRREEAGIAAYFFFFPWIGLFIYFLPRLQAQLKMDGCRDLYQFWSDRLARQLTAETDIVLNLASKEYSRAVEPHLPENVRFVTCTFGEWKGGKVIEKGARCKMARGQMVRWMAEHKIEDPENLRAFGQLGYCFYEELSTKNHFVFLKQPEQPI